MTISIEKATDTEHVHTCALIYAKPGMGKTTAFALEMGKKLLIDLDRSSDVVRSGENQRNIEGLKESIQTLHIIKVRTIPELNEVKELVKGEKYDMVCIDNLTELNDNLLNSYAKGNVPQIQHYLLAQNYIKNMVREYRDMGVDVVFTAWETSIDRTALNGAKYTQSYPSLSEKLADSVCGLCNVVAHIEIKVDENGNETRGYRLSGNQAVYAKDQIRGRKGCKIGELIL